MWPGFLNALTWWQWVILAAVPPAIILLYFLKLKRQPIEVPSTYLWHKSIEDLHVNSIWQRLRNNLLLWLQLLLLLLLMLALLRPYWHGKQLSGERFIFLIDNSASMKATDAGPSRLDETKRRVGELIDQMTSGEAAMIISFADSAKVEQPFTDNRRQLKRSLAAIEPTRRTTDLAEALKVASGLANPGRSAEDTRDYQVAEAMPATLYIFSDGNFKDVTDFRLGHLDPVYVAIGNSDAANVAITSFNVRPKESNSAELQAFAQLRNFGREDVNVAAELYLDKRLIDAGRFQIDAEWIGLDCVTPDDASRARLDVPGNQGLLVDGVASGSPAGKAGIQPNDVLLKAGDITLSKVNDLLNLWLCGRHGKSIAVELLRDGKKRTVEVLLPRRGRGVTFDIGEVESGVLMLELAAGDDFALDNVAYRVINPPQPANVLLVTPGNEPLVFALITESTEKIAEVRVESPAYLKTKDYLEAAAGGAWHMIIYDRCSPQVMPRANTLLIGSLPPGGQWSAGEEVGWPADPEEAKRHQGPAIIDIEAAHPLMQWIDLGDVLIQSATPLKPPPAATVLIDTVVGPVMAIAPRGQFEDTVTGFTIINEVEGADGKTQRYIGTNWMTRPSFPVFVLNLFDYLGGARDLAEAGNLRPGKAIALEAPKSKARLRVRTPAGKTTTVQTDELGKTDFTQTDELGVYKVQSGNETLRQFTVNLFDGRESDIRPRDFTIGNVDVERQQTWEATRCEGWKWILLIGLGVLLLEWYVYNRRVSL